MLPIKADQQQPQLQPNVTYICEPSQIGASMIGRPSAIRLGYEKGRVPDQDKFFFNREASDKAALLFLVAVSLHFKWM